MIKNYDQEIEKQHHPENFDTKEREEVERQIGYALEDGRLDFADVDVMDYEDKLEFVKKIEDYDPY